MTASTIATEAKRLTSWSIGVSLVMIIAGTLAIAAPTAAGFAVNFVVACMLILSGVAHLAFGWQLRAMGGAVWQVLLGALYIGVGAYVLAHSYAGLAALTLFLAAYLFAEGVLEAMLWFQMRATRGRGWLLLDSAITLVLAIMIWRTWPASTEWVIGTLVGISMIFSGASRLMLSLAARSLVTKLA